MHAWTRSNFLPYLLGIFRAFAPHLTVQVDKGAQVCHARQSIGVRQGNKCLFFLGSRGCSPRMNRAGKFSTCLGRERKKESLRSRMWGIRGVAPVQQRAERKVCLSQWPRWGKASSCKEMGGVSDVYFCLATHSQLLPQLRSTGACLPPLVLETGGQRSLGVSESGRACVAEMEVEGQPLPSSMLGSPSSAAVPSRGLTFRGDPHTTKFSP